MTREVRQLVVLSGRTIRTLTSCFSGTEPYRRTQSSWSGYRPTVRADRSLGALAPGAAGLEGPWRPRIGSASHPAYPHRRG